MNFYQIRLFCFSLPIPYYFKLHQQEPENSGSMQQCTRSHFFAIFFGHKSHLLLALLFFNKNCRSESSKSSPHSGSMSTIANFKGAWLVKQSNNILHIALSNHLYYFLLLVNFSRYYHCKKI